MDEVASDTKARTESERLADAWRKDVEERKDRSSGDRNRQNLFVGETVAFVDARNVKRSYANRKTLKQVLEQFLENCLDVCLDSKSHYNGLEKYFEKIIFFCG